MAFPVLLDACVLVPYRLADLLLWLAESELFQPLWSEEILAEVRRSMVSPKIGVPPAQADRRIGQMRAAFPHASIDHYQALVPGMTNDDKDRHVLAAAVRGQAALIVTANLKDFPPAALAPYDIEAIHPDDFLLDQLDLAQKATLDCVIAQRVAYSRPTVSFADFYAGLAATVPKFARRAQNLDAEVTFPPGMPLPIETASPENAAQAFFPDGDPDPSTALGAAFMWFNAVSHLDEFRTAAENLSVNPAAWEGYGQAAEIVAGLSIMQSVEESPDEPELIKYVKLIDTGGRAMRSFGEAVLREVYILTVVACPDGWWRVWGLSFNHVPSASEILGSPNGAKPADLAPAEGIAATVFETPRLEESYTEMLLEQLGLIDPHLNHPRSIGRARNTLLDIRQGKDKATLIRNTRFRFSNGHSVDITDNQAEQILVVVRELYEQQGTAIGDVFLPGVSLDDLR